MITAGIIIFLLWLITMSYLLTPTGLYTSAWDRLTKAKYRDDRLSLQIMLDHIRTSPELWSVSQKSASYPMEGAKRIYIEHDEKKGLTYSLSGGNFRPLDGFFGVEFNREITQENARREGQFLLREFYPELNGQVLLK